jgi:hypothetical protein
VSFNDRILSDADFRDRVEADAVARMNPERSPDGDWADRVVNLRAHADAIEAGDRRGAKLLREAATHIAFLAHADHEQNHYRISLTVSSLYTRCRILTSKPCSFQSFLQRRASSRT